MKQYIVDGGGTDAIKTLKIRLNMHRVFGNYKGDYELPRLCPHCQQEDDTTEHLILCTYFGESSLTEQDLHNTNNIQLWKQINERVDTNMKWR